MKISVNLSADFELDEDDPAFEYVKDMPRREAEQFLSDQFHLIFDTWLDHADDAEVTIRG
jgi:hypothetical protein